jgi:lipoprotein-anchoring transpeptidase ErfK/SrfK
MTDDNDRYDDRLERLLRGAFDAKANASFPSSAGVSDDRTPPPMRLPDHLSPRPQRHRQPHRVARWLAPLAAAAVVMLVAGLVVALTRDSSTTNGTGAVGSSVVTSPSHIASSASSAPSSSASATPAGKPVRVSSGVISDGSQVGVGMPIILLLSRQIKDARAFAAATSVTVNGKPVAGGWYFERRYQDKGHPVEADWRMRSYWPGHAQIHFELKAKGKSAGTGLVFANNLSLDFSTGAANIVTVDDATHRLTVESDGKQWGSFPVSLGAAATRTKRGIKVIMEKGNSICMSGPGYHECGIRYTQRLTYGGEYLHAAPWNTYNIAHGIDSSNGCTNLYTADAKKLYDFLEIGDVVKYPNANGALMQMGDGYGDWNVPWPQWQTGGLYAVN